MCSQTMMSSTETWQGFKVTKAFSAAPCNSASGLLREKHLSTAGTFSGWEKRAEMRAKHKCDSGTYKARVWVLTWHTAFLLIRIFEIQKTTTHFAAGTIKGLPITSSH